MKARVVIPTAAGERVSYDLAEHHSSQAGKGLRIVFSTSEEPFERWLFYLLREIGAHVVADDVAGFRRVLGLADTEEGIVDEHSIEDLTLNRHPATA
jgi:hypothetical protein